MDRKKIKSLVLTSYRNNVLDKNVVNAITKRLNRNSLKRYVNELKNYEARRTVVITTAFPCEHEIFKKLFQGKKIIFKKDRSLMVGIKILENDMLYEFNIRNRLEKLISHIEHSYD